MRVWVWHNGSDRATLDVVRSLQSHPRLHRLHHSPENVALTQPTNWFWQHARGELVGKIDDDVLVPDNWAQILRAAHVDEPRFGAISIWHLGQTSFDEQRAQHKIRSFRSGHRIVQNPWINGGGYLMKRRCIRHIGGLRKTEPFPHYCRRLAWLGWINGWYYPLLHDQNMDDPRSPFTLFTSDQAFVEHAPLTARRNGITTVDGWKELLDNNALWIQDSPVQPGRMFPLRKPLYQFVNLLSQRAKMNTLQCETSNV